MLIASLKVCGSSDQGISSSHLAILSFKVLSVGALPQQWLNVAYGARAPGGGDLRTGGTGTISVNIGLTQSRGRRSRMRFGNSGGPFFSFLAALQNGWAL